LKSGIDATIIFLRDDYPQRLLNPDSREKWVIAARAFFSPQRLERKEMESE
jgi:hypothetical protein